MIQPRIEVRPWVHGQQLITNPELLTVTVLELTFVDQIETITAKDLEAKGRYAIVGRFGKKAHPTKYPLMVLLQECGTGNLYRISRPKYVRYVSLGYQEEQGLDEATPVITELARAAYDNMPQIMLKEELPGAYHA